MAVGESTVIIGSGPSAIATALALCRRGENPLILDVGLELDQQRANARDRLGSTTPQHWSGEDLRVVKDQPPSGANRKIQRVLASKRLFGSDFTFEEDGVSDFLPGEGIGISPSYARGGMSNVWGAGLLTHSDRDTSGWPIGYEELEPHYREILGAIPYAAQKDGLAQRHPLVCEPDGALRQSDVARSIINRFARHEERLQRRGVSFGGSRLSVRAGEPAPWRGCVYCGRCLEGCPYGHIYSSAHTLADLVRNQQVRYRGARHVLSLEQLSDGVAIHVIGPDGQPETFSSAKVYLGAGALSSTRILQASGFLPERANLLDSQAVYVPFVWLGRANKRHLSANRHTLSEIFVVLEDLAIASSGVHVSMYTNSAGIVARARETHPLTARLLGPVYAEVLRSMVVGIAFLHSDHSHGMVSIARMDGSTALERRENPNTSGAVRAMLSRLQSDLGRFGLVPLTLLSRAAPVGGGYHLGGSIPMRAQSAPGSSDLLGRPYGARAIHVVDASCLPSIPGGPITLLMMANAHRIATRSLDVTT